MPTPPNLRTARHLHDELTKAMCAADIARINQLLSPSAALTHMTGYMQPKEEWLAEISAKTMVYYEITTVATEEAGTEYVFKTKCDADIWGTRRVWNLGLRYTLNIEENMIEQMRAFS